MTYTQLVVFGVLNVPVSNLPWFLGASLVMAYELGRDVVVKRRGRLELIELREQLAQAERVSVLGHLASALAHELIQPLTATAANVDAALMELENEDRISKNCAQFWTTSAGTIVVPSTLSTGCASSLGDT